MAKKRCRRKCLCKYHRPKPKSTHCCKSKTLSQKAYKLFLHTYKLKHCNWPSVKIAHLGARQWCKMTGCQKFKYYVRAQKRLGCRGPIYIPGYGCIKCPKRRRKRKGCAKKRRHVCRREDIGCGRKKRKCCRAEPPCPSDCDEF